MEVRNHKWQRRSEEPNTVHFAQPTAAERSHSTMNIVQILHESTSVIPNSPRLASGTHLTRIPDVNATHIPGPACRSSKIAIPNKRRNPFGKGGPRKKKKTERYVDVRIYAQRKDLGHTHEIQCALTPDGSLDLASLSQKLNFKGCQASHPDL